MFKKIIIVFSAMLLVLSAFAGCQKEEAPIYVPDSTSAATEVVTPYGTLLYPADWANNIQIEKTDADSTYSVNFMCKIGEKTFDLFSVIFSNNVQGDELVGRIEKDGTSTPVYINHNEYISDGTLSKEDEDIIYGMLEGVNDIRYYIQQFEGFVAK